MSVPEIPGRMNCSRRLGFEFSVLLTMHRLPVIGRLLIDVMSMKVMMRRAIQELLNGASRIGLVIAQHLSIPRSPAPSRHYKYITIMRRVMLENWRDALCCPNLRKTYWSRLLVTMTSARCARIGSPTLAIP